MTNKPEGRSEVARDRNVLQLALTGAAPFTRGGDARPTGGNWRDIANFEERRYRTYVGIGTGNPRVFQGYPYPHPPKTRTRAQGAGFHGYGYRVLRVRRV